MLLIVGHFRPQFRVVSSHPHPTRTNTQATHGRSETRGRGRVGECYPPSPPANATHDPRLIILNTAATLSSRRDGLLRMKQVAFINSARLSPQGTWFCGNSK